MNVIFGFWKVSIRVSGGALMLGLFFWGFGFFFVMVFGSFVGFDIGFLWN